MKIGIDLNDVVRDFTRNFARCYNQFYDRQFDFEDFEVWTNDMRVLFPFKSDSSYESFTYETYVFDLFSKCGTCYPKLGTELNEWITNTIKDVDLSEDIEVCIVSTMEYGLSIPSTYSFLAKIGCKAREVYLPVDSLDIWNDCDIVVTANPKLISSKPEGKVCVKIETDYNKECQANISYATLSPFIKGQKGIERAFKELQSARLQ